MQSEELSYPRADARTQTGVVSIIEGLHNDIRQRANENIAVAAILDSENDLRRLAHPKYRADIDGLRAVAVLLVLGFHAFPNRIKGGFMGVDIFFVISGYLISGIIFRSLENDSFSYIEFVVRRIKRIFPALIVVLGSIILAGWQVLLAAEYQQLGKQIAAGAAFVSNLALWNESGYFEKSAELKPLLHLWSLGIEEQFYIFWPLSVGLAWKRKLNLAVLTISIVIISFLVNLVTSNTDSVAAFYSPLSRFWELLFGGGLAYISIHHPHVLTKSPNLQSCVGVLLIFLGSFLLNTQRVFPGWWALMPTTGAWLVISAGPTAWLNQHALANPISVAIGKISYPLYLWHWPLLSFAWIIGDGAPSIALRIGLICLAFILSALTYFFIEKPIRSQRSYNIAKILFAIMIVVGIAGASIYFANGFKFRLIGNNPVGFDFDLGYNDYRYERCFLKEHDRLPFDSFCEGISAGDVKKPLVLIWGDSHAHSLALGLTDQGKIRDFDVAQYTASACPPLIEFIVDVRPECHAINQFVADKIAELRPHTVIIAAFWYLYNGYAGYPELDFNKLAATISYLKRLNIENIVLFGQLPTFLIDQPKVGNRKFVSDKIDRTFYKFNYESALINEKIRSAATESQIKFVSPKDLICNNDGCLISASRTKLVPLAWDYGHLTRAGADYIFNEAIQQKQLLLP